MIQPFVAVPSYADAGTVAVDSHARSLGIEIDAGSLSSGAAKVDSPSSATRVTNGCFEAPSFASVDSGRHGRGTGQMAPAIDSSVLGPLEPFARRTGVTDLFVNGDRGLWIDDGHGARRVQEWDRDEQEVRDLAVRLVAIGGRHVDEATPCVDVRLGGGIRVHVVLSPISTTGTVLSVRMPRSEGLSLVALERAGMFTAALARGLVDAVERRENLLVTGAGGSGKTTLLAALLGAAPANERIVTIEDVAELRIDHPHVVGLEARQANLEGAGRVGLESLLREALRMRPDRLVVGECRGAEVRELLAALNTGHDGGAGTLHANSLHDVPARIEALGALAGMSSQAVARQTVSAIGLVLHLERRDGVRRLAQMGRFAVDRRERLVVEEQ
ncbi:TadA family conjugal transfer-associated ATPase [Luethyella okanaganae]|uniref:TadA family conjugal transfer-associated ATPase n=1 Tax=Luethyella okanaganae TaxID=69372 RepID=A0ABW1VCE3_9MICO